MSEHTIGALPVGIVTGAGRGLGRHFARALADRGMAVAAVGRAGSAIDETVALVNDAGGVTAAFVADVREPEAAADVMAAVGATLGPVELLINNAGTMNLGRIEDIDADAWWTDFEVNVHATMVWCQAAIAAMRPRGRGTIVNIGSASTQWVVPAGSAYIASKAAVISLTRILAAELDGTGIRTFCFGPWARTDMTDGLATSPRVHRRAAGDLPTHRRCRGAASPRWDTANARPDPRRRPRPAHRRVPRQRGAADLTSARRTPAPQPARVMGRDGPARSP